VFRELPVLLRPGDLLVLNRSRVFPARLRGHRAGGGDAEILLVQRQGASTTWSALARPGRRLRPGDVVTFAGGLRVTIVSGPSPDGSRDVRFECDPSDVDAWIARIGDVPLPPYIQRPTTEQDRERYQTIYARETGSVAAPTAGLHFTPALLGAIRARGIETVELLLHVGPGTFRPVQVDDVADHRVSPEPFLVPEATASAIDAARREGRRVVAVGTTTVRTLESAVDPSGRVQPGPGRTDLVIVPGYRFRAVDALVTNFHLPRSSLLLLVCAFAGRERLLSAYRTAIASGYRFYSYGDGMLISR
jgi:S-adenosylmethionine:tRNA ribosyltransferase-isomerase